jgi:hypothetical protein
MVSAPSSRVLGRNPKESRPQRQLYLAVRAVFSDLTGFVYATITDRLPFCNAGLGSYVKTALTHARNVKVSRPKEVKLSKRRASSLETALDRYRR